jgi:hypothetical protein
MRAYLGVGTSKAFRQRGHSTRFPRYCFGTRHFWKQNRQKKTTVSSASPPATLMGWFGLRIKRVFDSLVLSPTPTLF